MPFSWSSFLVFIAVQTFTPGPNTMSTLANASRVGFKKNLPFALGITTGVIGITFVCGLVYERIERFMPQVQPFMQILGVAYLLYLAYKILKTDFSAAREREVKGNTFLNGIMLEFVNPKLFFYCLMAMSQYVIPNFHTQAAIAGFTLLIGVACFASLLTYATVGSVLLKTIARYGKWVNVVLALALVYCAVKLFF